MQADSKDFVIAANFVGSEKKVEQAVPSPYGIADAQFTRTMGALLGSPLVDGNTVTELLNGDRIFPEMLVAIRGAKRTITFESFIHWSGDIGKEFAETISERARAGVKVRILLDRVGSSKKKPEWIEALKNAGCEVERYHALKWYHLTRLNNRTHHKLLVIDGRTGFTGGVGIGDEWKGDAQDPEHWRDTHFKVVGPKSRSWVTSRSRPRPSKSTKT